MENHGAPPVSGLPPEIGEDEALNRKFCLETTIGIGGMGIVVAARHLELDQRVAIKFLHPDVARSPAALSRFRREARTAAKIKNEHVVRIIDTATTTAGIPYIVMEYLEGRDLEQVLRTSPDGRIAAADAIGFVLQATEALAEGHKLGIVHRDLKPANLFCVECGDGNTMIKLLDFGISKIGHSPNDADRTDRHEILGSPSYMSPEQIDASSDVDQRSDIWSLGVILYEAVTGRKPFSDEFVSELWRRIRRDTPQPIEIFCPGAPPLLGQVVAKCLEKEPGKRYSHVGELATALAGILVGAASPVLANSTVPRPAAPIGGVPTVAYRQPASPSPHATRPQPGSPATAHPPAATCPPPGGARPQPGGAHPQPGGAHPRPGTATLVSPGSAVVDPSFDLCAESSAAKPKRRSRLLLWTALGGVLALSTGIVRMIGNTLGPVVKSTNSAAASVSPPVSCDSATMASASTVARACVSGGIVTPRSTSESGLSAGTSSNWPIVAMAAKDDGDSLRKPPEPPPASRSKWHRAAPVAAPSSEPMPSPFSPDASSKPLPSAQPNSSVPAGSDASVEMRRWIVDPVDQRRRRAPTEFRSTQ